MVVLVHLDLAQINLLVDYVSYNAKVAIHLIVSGSNPNITYLFLLSTCDLVTTKYCLAVCMGTLPSRPVTLNTREKYI